MYRDFARIYDELMLNHDYDEWGRRIAGLLLEQGVATGRGLDLACGSAQFAVRLADRYKMCGVDLSQEMLNVARERMRGRRLEFPLVQQDIRKLEVGKAFDFAVAMCDGISYLTTGLDKALLRIGSALRTGGVFVFDISTTMRLLEVLGNNIFTYDSENIVYIWHNECDVRNRLVYMNLTFFERTGAMYNRFSEQHVMRAYSGAEVVEALGAAGFEVLGIYGDLSSRDCVGVDALDAAAIAGIESTENRLHFVCRKV